MFYVFVHFLSLDTLLYCVYFVYKSCVFFGQFKVAIGPFRDDFK